ncbi:hypothetical protein ABIF14_005447 [Bradyrhizobium elkanii]|nr:hypothetical protein [Bradyrhizobium elkanii]
MTRIEIFNVGIGTLSEAGFTYSKRHNFAEVISRKITECQPPLFSI